MSAFAVDVGLSFMEILTNFAQSIKKMNVKTPKEITDITLGIGKNKVAIPLGKLIIQAFQAGMFVAFGGTLSVIVGSGFPEVTAMNPSMQKILSGLVFPIGLILVVVLGAELFTGNNALLIPGCLKGNFGWRTVLKNWSVVYFVNFAGSLFFAWLFVYYSGLTASGPYHTAIVSIAEAKCAMPWMVCMVKGIGANWCVCLAVWLALAGHNLVEKVLGCFLPVMAFVVLGYEHCIANMFFIPLGMMEGAQVSVGQFLWNNLIPATIGNVIGGAFLIGAVNTYVHLRK